MSTNNAITTLGELLKAAETDPKLLWRAHRKVWKAISAPVDGKEPVALSELEGAQERRLFHDQPSQRLRYPRFKEFHGIDPELAEFAEYFKKASSGGKFEKLVVEVTGNTGCGKTTLIETVAEQMRHESFFYLSDCEYHEHPLHAVPLEARKDIFERFYKFRGELCSRCEANLQQKYDNNWRNLPVKKSFYRLSAGVGMLCVETVLSAEPRRSGGIPDDWHRIFKHANGGCLFINLAEQHEELCSLLMNYVTDGTLPAKDRTSWWPDFAVVAVGNKRLADLEKDVVVAERKITDRVLPIKLRFVTDPLAELEIQRKEQMEEVEKRSFHFVPWVEEAGCRVITASRLEPDNYQAKLKLKSDEALGFWGGGALLAEDKTSLTTISYKELRRLRPGDGTRGITVRGGTKLFGSVGQYHECAGIDHLLMAFREAELDKTYDGETMARIKEQLGSLDKNEVAPVELWYQERAVQDLVRGLIGHTAFEKKQKDYLGGYLENADAYVNKTTVKDPKTKETLAPDEAFMKSIEEQIAIIGSSCDVFRSGVVLFNDHPPLKEAVLKKIVGEHLAEIKRAVTGKESNPEKAATFDPNKARQTFDKIKKGLLEVGYRSCCVENVLNYARKIFK